MKITNELNELLESIDNRTLNEILSSEEFKRDYYRYTDFQVTNKDKSMNLLDSGRYPEKLYY